MQQIVGKLGWVATGVLALLVVGALSGVISAGPLDPNGPPGSTMKTLQDVEPRTAVQSLPGSVAAVHVISAPGSYYLTGNITGEPGKNGISITASNVTLDLNGFTVDGAGTGNNGINANGTFNDITIRNGRVSGWNVVGISTGGLSERWLIEDVQVRDNALQGVQISFWSIVRDCEIIGNGVGIFVGMRSIVEDCYIAENEGTGLSAADESVVRDNTVRRNEGDGILVGADSTVIGNVAIDNGLGANDGAGVHVMGTTNRIEQNEVNGNDRGIDVDSGLNIVIRNAALTNSTNYDIVAGNTVGPIVNSANIASSSNPHANYTN